MSEKLFNQIAKKYQPAIKDIYRDDDGFWCTLNREYKLNGYCSERTIHEDTMKELKSVLRTSLTKV